MVFYGQKTVFLRIHHESYDPKRHLQSALHHFLLKFVWRDHMDTSDETMDSPLSPHTKCYRSCSFYTLPTWENNRFWLIQNSRFEDFLMPVLLCHKDTAQGTQSPVLSLCHKDTNQRKVSIMLDQWEWITSTL